MTTTSNFEELRAQMTPERRERNRAAAMKMLAAMPLAELRAARRMTQETLAEAYGAQQATISKLENRTDAYVSTIRRYIEAMGGTLEIVARFADGDVRIDQFGAIGA